MTNLSPSTNVLLPALPSSPSLPRKGTPQPDKLTSTAKEFESVLLTQWLQAAESSFGTVPGDDEDADGGGEQMKSFGIQQLATALTDAGGIGIANMVSKALAHADAAATPRLHESASASR